MIDRRIVPRCPRCNKRVGDWLDGDGGYTCRHCHTKFEIVEGRVLVVEPMTFKEYSSRPLTIIIGSDRVESKT